MAEELEKAARVLGGEIETQFVYRPNQTSMVTAEAAVRADQELVCGYKLIMLKQRSMELSDAQGPYMEVFVTYGPYPTYEPNPLQPGPAEPTPTTPSDGTQA